MGQPGRKGNCREGRLFAGWAIWYNAAANLARALAAHREGIAVTMLDDYLGQYGLVAIFLALSIVVPSSMMMASYLFSRLGIRPNRPNPVKQDTYECGVETIGGRWNRFQFQYYMFAILFVVFDVEVVFLYPWATKFLTLELFALIEMAVFVGILMLAWAYAWRKRDLEWRG